MTLDTRFPTQSVLGQIAEERKRRRRRERDVAEDVLAPERVEEPVEPIEAPIEPIEVPELPPEPIQERVPGEPVLVEPLPPAPVVPVEPDVLLRLFPRRVDDPGLFGNLRAELERDPVAFALAIRNLLEPPAFLPPTADPAALLQQRQEDVAALLEALAPGEELRALVLEEVEALDTSEELVRRVEQASQAVFSASLDELALQIQQDPEGVLDTIEELGPTDDTLLVLSAMGLTQEEIVDVFVPPEQQVIDIPDFSKLGQFDRERAIEDWRQGANRTLAQIYGDLVPDATFFSPFGSPEHQKAVEEDPEGAERYFEAVRWVENVEVWMKTQPGESVFNTIQKHIEDFLGMSILEAAGVPFEVFGAALRGAFVPSTEVGRSPFEQSLRDYDQLSLGEQLFWELPLLLPGLITDFLGIARGVFRAVRTGGKAAVEFEKSGIFKVIVDLGLEGAKITDDLRDFHLAWRKVMQITDEARRAKELGRLNRAFMVSMNEALAAGGLEAQLAINMRDLVFFNAQRTSGAASATAGASARTTAAARAAAEHGEIIAKQLPSFTPGGSAVPGQAETLAEIIRGTVAMAPEGAPLIEALVKDAEALLAKAKEQAPENALTVEFETALEKVRTAAPEAKRAALIEVETLEAGIKELIGEPAVVAPEVPPTPSENDVALVTDTLQDVIGKSSTTSFTGQRVRSDLAEALAALETGDLDAARTIIRDTAGRRGVTAANKQALNTALSILEPPPAEVPAIAPEAAVKPVEEFEDLFPELAALPDETPTDGIEASIKAEDAVPAPEPSADAVVAPGPVNEATPVPEVTPPTDAPMSELLAAETPVIQDAGALAIFRPTRKVFQKMGLRRFWQTVFKAETVVFEDRAALEKELRGWEKQVKDKDRRALMFRSLDTSNSAEAFKQLTFEEKRIAIALKKKFDDWADALGIPADERIENYVTHIFEKDIRNQLDAAHPLDPETIKAITDTVPRTLFNPFLLERLGKTEGLIEDPFAAARVYGSRAIKQVHFEPLLQKLAFYERIAPPSAAAFLRDYSRRITNRPGNFERDMDAAIKGFAERLLEIPAFKNSPILQGMTQNKFTDRAVYNYTSALFTLWLGFKPTAAIRNVSQQLLSLAAVGPVHFSKAFALRFTEESKAAFAESLVRRSRKGAFLPGIDSSFASRWSDAFREKALFLFRAADGGNVHTAFLSGYYEAKAFFPKADRSLWIARGDEVAADTQFLYTKMNSPAWAQGPQGRVLAMLTSWFTNWTELMIDFTKGSPSQVYLEHTRATGQKPSKKTFVESRKALLLYLALIGLAYKIQDEERLKAFEYIGLTSIGQAGDLISGDFPALEIPGAVADMIAGLATDDERKLKEGFNTFSRTLTPAILRQIENVSQGEKDWATLLFYMEGRDFQIKKLRDEWRPSWNEYEDLRTEKEKRQWRIDNPKLEAQMFVTDRFTTLLTEEARQEALRLIEKHDIDVELIEGYDKVFGADTVEPLDTFQGRIGKLEALEFGEEPVFFTMENFATEVNNFLRQQGRGKVERDGQALAIEYLHATDTWAPYFDYDDREAKLLYRRRHPEVEANLYIWGRITTFENPQSAELVKEFMDKFDIEPVAIRAFREDPAKFDELSTPAFDLRLANVDLDEESREFIDNTRRIEALELGADDDVVEAFVDYSRTVEDAGGTSREAKLFRLDHPAFDTWGQAAFEWQPIEQRRDLLELDIQLEDLEPGTPEHQRLTWTRQAKEVNLSDSDTDSFVEFRQIDRPDDLKETSGSDLWYEDDWFLIENIEFYNRARDAELLSVADFRTVPTRQVFATYLKYLKVDVGFDRLAFRQTHSDLEKWLVLKFDMAPIEDRGTGAGPEDRAPAPPRVPREDRAAPEGETESERLRREAEELLERSEGVLVR